MNIVNIAYQATATYSLITSTGYCKHVSGGIPSHCWKYPIASIDICESYCTNQKSCVGYEHTAIGRVCDLFTSDTTCPSGFTFSSRSETAKTMTDLVAFNNPSEKPWNCSGKTSGNCIFHFCTLDIVENQLIFRVLNE